MRHGSLFSGVGGFDIAAKAIGWENVFQVEIDKFCQQVLEKRFPNTRRHGDIKQFDARQYRGQVDVLSGGDPCQPHSVAGLGKGTSDDRYLWPEMFRIAQELDVPWIVNENVSGSIANGVLDLKIDDLERVGYACQAYCIPAEAVGALHQRERVWLVAYHSSFDAARRGSKEVQGKTKGSGLQEWNHVQHIGEPVNLWPPDSDPNLQRRKECYLPSLAANTPEGYERYFGFGPHAHGNIRRDTIESGIVRMLDGLPQGMEYADRNKRIKALGNAIVWQVAFQIFKAIDQYGHIIS